MARAASLTVPSGDAAAPPFEGKARKPRSRPADREPCTSAGDEFVELLDAMQVSQARSAPAMEPENVPDLLRDLAEPTPVRSCTAFATRTSWAGAALPTTTASHHFRAGRHRDIDRTAPSRAGALARLSSVPTVSDSARSDTVPDCCQRPRVDPVAAVEI
jgi:hypothetical protein